MQKPKFNDINRRRFGLGKSQPNSYRSSELNGWLKLDTKYVVVLSLSRVYPQRQKGFGDVKIQCGRLLCGILFVFIYNHAGFPSKVTCCFVY